MTHEVDQKERHISGKKDEADITLGKRHDYDSAVPSDLSGTAHKIGFTPREVRELERLYKKRVIEQ